MKKGVELFFNVSEVAKVLILLQLRETFYLSGQKLFSFQFLHIKMLMLCNNSDPITTHRHKERGI